MAFMFRYAYPWWREKEIVSELKRLKGLCLLTPEETALVLKALGYGNETHIYIASGEIYGSQAKGFAQYVSSNCKVYLSNQYFIQKLMFYFSDCKFYFPSCQEKGPFNSILQLKLFIMDQLIDDNNFFFCHEIGGTALVIFTMQVSVQILSDFYCEVASIMPTWLTTSEMCIV